MEWYVLVLNKYAVFTGRAQRAEYWYFVLFNSLFWIGLRIFDRLLSMQILSTVYALAVFIPGLAVAVRRLHDTDRNGWWLLIGLIPIIGWIILIIFLAEDGQPQENRYGSNPKVLIGVPAAQSS